VKISANPFHGRSLVSQRDGQMQLVGKLSSKFLAALSGSWYEGPDSAVVIPIGSNIQRQYSGFLVAGLSSRLKFSGASITYDPMPTVMLGEAHLQQLFQNRIADGIKDRKESEPPRIHISAIREEEYWRFSVTDN
jgi:hypothetical protein